MHIRGKIPLTIRPLFWVLAGLIGFLQGGSFSGAILWVAIVLISLLFHEYGHALAALAFGKRPRIELGMLGGVTLYDGRGLSRWRQFIIVLSGPVMGALLFFICVWSAARATDAGKGILEGMAFINMWWTLFNLLPILPLDGGQMMRITLEACFGARGTAYAFLAGGVMAMLIGTLAFAYGLLFIGVFLLFCAMQNYEGWRQARLLPTLGIQKKAFQLYAEGHFDEAYQLFLSAKTQLTPDALCLLHKMAFERGDDKVVVLLSGACFQVAPQIDIALRSAKACARLGQVEPAIGWLTSAEGLGAEHIEIVCQGAEFDSIRRASAFQNFITRH